MVSTPITIRPELTTVVVTYNGASWIEQCLESLAASLRPTHVIVVDNCSTDATVQIIKSQFPEVELIESRINIGFGSGNNVGIARALDLGSELIFLLNQDAFVSAEALGQMVDFMVGHQEFGVVSPIHCSPDVHTLDSKTYDNYLRTYARHWLCDAALGRPQGHYRIRGINAAAWLVRGSVFEQVGGFDPLFFMYGEDDDLINRFETHKVGFALLPQARIVHHRQSPPRPAAKSWFESVNRRAARVRSDLLLKAKSQHFTRLHMLLQLLVHGIATPIVDSLIRRDVLELTATLVATCQVLLQLNPVFRSAALCAAHGPHFLPHGGRPRRWGAARGKPSS